MATRPNPPGGTRPPNSGPQRRLTTPSPASGQQRRPTRPSTAGMKPVQTPPPATRAPARERRAETPEPHTGGGAPHQPPIARLKTKGLPIKSKIVLAMSGLTVGVSLLIFIIVATIATGSLDETIEQSGVGMLQQAEGVHRHFKSGLNEKELISYFGQPANRTTKFDSYWDQISERFFHSRISPCDEFATWSQLESDRVWVEVASQFLDDPDIAIDPEVARSILGEEYERLARLEPDGDGTLSPPEIPRQVNEGAIEGATKARLSRLFRRWRLDSSKDSFRDLRAVIDNDTRNNLIDSPNGLRKKIYQEYKQEFVEELNELTSNEDSQVRYVIISVDPATLDGFSADEMRVISQSENLEVTDTSSGEVGETVINPEASVNNVPAYSFHKRLGENDSIAIFLDREQIQARKSGLLWSILGISVVGIGLAVFLAFIIGGSITKPLQTLMRDIQVISGGNFDHQPAARSNDEIGIVSRLLGDMATSLKSAQSVWLENQSRKHDLDVAKEIQENLLPKHVPRIAGYDVSAYYSPSKEVGGDYYDFFLVDKTHLGMICADVSGKGIPGSMVMMMTKALVSYEAQENLSPRDIFCKVNRTLAKDIKRGMFVTAFYMLLDIPTARLTVASAGHNPLLLYRAATKQCVEVNPGGIALGFDKDGRLFERNMKEEVVQLQRGDRVVIYTDGVTEAMSPTGEEFGEERMSAVTVQAASRSSSEYLTTLVNAIQAHSQADDQHDDITIVTLKVG